MLFCSKNLHQIAFFDKPCNILLNNTYPWPFPLYLVEKLHFVCRKRNIMNSRNFQSKVQISFLGTSYGWKILLWLFKKYDISWFLKNEFVWRYLFSHKSKWGKKIFLLWNVSTNHTVCFCLFVWMDNFSEEGKWVSYH